MAITPGYVGSAGITWSASTTASVAGQSIGTASLDRIVVIAITVEETALINSVTIDGTAMTQGISVRNTTGTPDNAAAIFYLPWPTGTTATFAVTLSATSSLAGRISVWAMTGADPLSKVSNSAQGAGATQTLSGITIPQNGAAFYAFNNATAATSVAWTNATVRDNTAAATYRHSVADTTTAGTPTVTADGATTNQILAGIAFSETAPVGAAFVTFAIITSQVFGLNLNYQDTAYCPPPIVAPAVTATPDQWMPRWDKPVRELLGLASGEPFIPEEATRDNTTNTLWPLAKGEIARPPIRIADQGSHLFVPEEATVENTTVRVWPLAFGDKARAIPRPAPIGGAPFIPKEATADNTTTTLWPITFGEVARPVMRVAQQGAWVFGYPYVSVDNNQTLDKWQQPLGRAVPVPRSAPIGGAPFVPAEATVANTVSGGWWQPLRGTAVAHWWPTRPASPFVPKEATVENTVPGGWWQPFVPAAPLPPFSFTQPVYATVVAAPPNTFTIDKWQQPLSRSVRIPRNAPVGGQPFVARAATVENTISGIAWLEAWKGPPRYRPGKTQVIYPVRFIPFVDNTTTLDKWQFHWKGPPRHRPRRIDAQFYVPHLTVVFHQSIDCDVTVTVDMHICGWGTAAQEAEGFVEQAQQSDPWSDQAERSDDYDEKDECGR